MWRFLKSEMHVILALSEDATRTDAQIAELYGMNKGTVASVRRRMLDAGAIFMVNIPAFNKLGCELVAFHAGAMDPAVPAEIRTNSYISFVDHTPNIYHAIVGGGNLAMFTVFKDISDLEGFIQEHTKFFSNDRRTSKAKLRTAMFPYSLSKGTYTTNFSPLIHKFFELERPKPRDRPLQSVEVVGLDLTENEAKILLAMVSNPLASDREIAVKTDLSRQAVTRIRNKMYEEGYLTKVCIPHLYRWGFELYVVSHTNFSMEMRWDIRLKSEPSEVRELSFLTLTRADEAIGNFMVPRYQEYVDGLEGALEWYHKMNVFDEPPRMTPFSLERSTELRTFDFLPALENLLRPVIRRSK